MSQNNSGVGCAFSIIFFIFIGFILRGSRSFISFFPLIFIFLVFAIAISSNRKRKTKKNAKVCLQRPTVNPYKIVKQDLVLNKSNYDQIIVTQPQFCHYCGCKLEKDAIFCHECGTKIEGGIL